MRYLYETHCHSSQCSRCAHSFSQQMVRAYQAKGYTGLVLTDHFIHGNTAVSPNLPWRLRMQKYYDAFLDAKKVGDKLDFDVIFGFEHYYSSGKEVLVYGVELDFLLDHPEIPWLDIEAFSKLVHEAGGVLIHAHPYRQRRYIDDRVLARVDLVDGIEIYNAFNEKQENVLALALARTGDYIHTCGGDTHDEQEPEIGAAGIWLDRRVKTSREFADALKEKKHGFRVNFRDENRITEAMLR